MSAFAFQPGSSLLHRMDAVSKIVWLAMTTVAIIFISSLPLIAAMFIVVVLTGVVLGRIRLRTFLRRLAFPGIVAAWLFLFLSVSTANPDQGASVGWGPLSVTVASASYGAALGIRILTLACISTVFVLTTDPRRMVEEMVKFGRLPYRAGFAIYAALRFLPLLESEARNVRHAHAVRADESGRRGLLGRMIEIKRLTIPLLAGALRRVQITAVAMDSRGFGAHKTRTDIDLLKRHPSGTVLIIGQALVICVAALLQIKWGGAFLKGPVSGS